MHSTELCQALLDHIARELPHEQDALLGLAALAAFHPDEVRLFVTESVVLLMRTGCAVPEALADEIGQRLAIGGTMV